MTNLALFTLSATLILTILLWPHRQPRYTEDRNGSWIAEDKPIFGLGVLTTWREVTGGTLTTYEER